MENLIITISREYGSGGRLIGEKVAQKLGIAFYNHNIVDMIAHESGFDKEYIRHWEKQVSSPVIWGVVPTKYHREYYINLGKMHAAQTKIIREIAEKGSCVIVGRCADYILREHKPILNVLIHADKQARVARVQKEYKEQDAKRIVEAVDRGRKNYYEQNTGRIWGDGRNYDLVLDSETYGIDGCVDMILATVEKLNKNI